VIERDGRPEKPASRPGAPQSFHLHQVLPRGEQILESLFPGLLADMQAGGAFPTQNTLVQMTNSYGTIPFPSATAPRDDLCHYLARTITNARDSA
jgi:hypothetical protein